MLKDFLAQTMSVKWIIKLEHLEISIKLQILTESVMIVTIRNLMKMPKVTMAIGNIQL